MQEEQQYGGIKKTREDESLDEGSMSKKEKTVFKNTYE